LIAGNWQTTPIPFLPHGAGWPWLLPIGVAALCVGALTATLIGKQPWMRIGAEIVFVIALSNCLLPRELWTPAWLIGFYVAVLANAQALQRHAQQFGWIAPLSWAMLLGGAATVLVYAHSGRLADAATLLAAPLLGLVPILVWRKLDARSCALCIATYLPALMASGFHETFSEVPWLSFALIGCAPLWLLVANLPVIRRQRLLVQAIVQIALLFVPVAAAIALAIRAEGFAIGY
jgi:hypothetical protein